MIDDRKRLYLRNPIRLDDVPIDDINAIVFVLEYMVSIPVGVPIKSVFNNYYKYIYIYGLCK